MNYLDKFSGLAEIYDNYRPHYSDKFLNELKTRVDLNKEDIIVDIGAGTGILTESLLRFFDNNIIAIEPNNDMRYLLNKKLGENSRLVIKNTLAEKTSLENNSISLITVAQAFHWFNVENFRIECKRILKENGLVCLVWNSRMEDNSLAQDSINLFKNTCVNYSGFGGGAKWGYKYKDSFFKEYEYFEIDCPMYFDLSTFIGRNLSSSYAPKENDKNYKEFLNGLIDLYLKYNNNGLLKMENKVIAYIGKI